ncbi:hypothetical protein SODALDRAFT_271060 [Sodiomyces alkalinus F11]|uniref:F-box domain-containing protein n=1 Tax=Sodiomyces alkalinus (strain CBS 110278 / VKM F-3762 / F11) TaxID=1314773 RepID=A0A3N2Q3Q9_SODAK|nr:hypothetical protein SODALDRAFT_271060 [Sodiomyces alkalinus F11]ROT41265.1 hypothetical protein SODALDRAFT_271060 [Sodiomyces alkalinus F11]
MTPPLSSSWPSGTIPIEIFDHISSYLSRLDVKNLRLVNKEFEENVSAKYFRSVVVPFKAEMYTSAHRLAADRASWDHQSQGLSRPGTLLSDGMRIFQSFGQHIVRFALSLELDEDTLAYPPTKPTQKAIPTYWGIYRWPHDSYMRYTELEGLEQAADETASLKDALQCLSQVRELALCCDAGLGYLCGPDRNPDCPPKPHPVFGLRNKPYQARQRRQERMGLAAKPATKPAFENPHDFKYNVLASMVRSAGYAEPQVRDAVNVLLWTERTSLMGIDVDERTISAPSIETPDGFAEGVTNHDTSHPLQPRWLTRAQQELLLELEWVHRALIQSYIIAVIDNSRASLFQSLTTLTVAKIPSSHVFMFQRNDFWQSLPSLNVVSFAVVPDWRNVAKIAPGCLQDISVSPVDSVSHVFTLLQEFVGRQRNITSLHFEWLCGGEFAPGLYQRNRYVLPAPLCMPTWMVHPDAAKSPDQLLSLPFVNHLSLKNCYATPHVFVQVLRTMALESLQRLELESVSLTGRPMTTEQLEPVAAQANQPAVNAALAALIEPDPTHQNQNPGGGVQAWFQAVQAATQNPFNPGQGTFGNNLHQQQHPVLSHLNEAAGGASSFPAPAWPATTPARLTRPSLFSWDGIIDHFTPGPNMADLISSGRAKFVSQPSTDPDISMDFLPQPGNLRRQQHEYKLNRMTFRSCGYVGVAAPFIDTRSVLPDGSPWEEPFEINARRKVLAPYVQQCSDKLAAKIVNWLRPQEHHNLCDAFGMGTKWTNWYDAHVIQAAKLDGIMDPGRGRFSGDIVGAKSPPFSPRSFVYYGEG